LFAAENDSVTACIRRRRLDECAFELAQPQWRGRSVTATASDWGFRSATHFARAFKAAYGATPSAFKQAHRGTSHSVRRDEKRSARPSGFSAAQ
jgi:AraC family transcriptional regulator, positive regulator of tynA and feaB